MPSRQNLEDVRNAVTIVHILKESERSSGMVTGYLIEDVCVRKNWNKHSETYTLKHRDGTSEAKIVVSSNSIIFHGNRKHLETILKSLYIWLI